MFDYLSCRNCQFNSYKLKIVNMHSNFISKNSHVTFFWYNYVQFWYNYFEILISISFEVAWYLDTGKLWFGNLNFIFHRMKSTRNDDNNWKIKHDTLRKVFFSKKILRLFFSKWFKMTFTRCLMLKRNAWRIWNNCINFFKRRFWNDWIQNQDTLKQELAHVTFNTTGNLFC